MKLTYTILGLIVGVSLSVLAGDKDAEVLALGEWSAPVPNKYGFALRGRLLISEYPEHRGPNTKTEAALYLELQEYSDFVGAKGEVYWNPAAVDCTLTDTSGRPVPNSPSAYGGPVPSPCWITLPSHSSMRLRVSPYAGGRLPDGDFGIWTARFQVWTLKRDDTNTYYLSGKFTVDPPTNRIPADFRYVWKGSLDLPKMRVGIAELKPQPSGAAYFSPAAGSKSADP